MTIVGISLAVVFGGIIAFNLIKGFMVKRLFASYQAPVTTVQETKGNPSINAVGHFVAMNSVDIHSQVTGKISKINFESGQHVAQGIPLIDMDDSIEQAQLKLSQAELALKQLNYNRQTKLRKRRTTSNFNIDEAKANVQQAQAKVEEIEAQIRQKHITAPFPGQLSVRQVNVGQYINPDQTTIVTLQSLDPLYFEFYLPEALYKKVRLNQKITLSIEELPNVLFEGRISLVNPKIEPKTHKVMIQATLSNCPAIMLKNPTQSSLVSTHQEKHGDKLIVQCNSTLNAQNKVQKYMFVPGMIASIKIN